MNTKSVSERVGRAMVAEELPHGRFVAATSILEWRRKPERLNREAFDFARSAWRGSAGPAQRSGAQ